MKYDFEDQQSDDMVEQNKNYNNEVADDSNCNNNQIK